MCGILLLFVCSAHRYKRFWSISRIFSQLIHNLHHSARIFFTLAPTMRTLATRTADNKEHYVHRTHAQKNMRRLSLIPEKINHASPLQTKVRWHRSICIEHETLSTLPCWVCGILNITVMCEIIPPHSSIKRIQSDIFFIHCLLTTNHVQIILTFMVDML